LPKAAYAGRGRFCISDRARVAWSDTAAVARSADEIVRDSVTLQLALEEFLQHAED
jgi:hypothetical protein